MGDTHNTKNALVIEKPITNAFAVSNTIVKYFIDKKKDSDLLKTLKLIYICFGSISVVKNQYLFAEEIQAWTLGPVVPKIYYPLRKSINQYARNTKKSYQLDNKGFVEEEIQSLIEVVCEVYSDWTATQLINLTHLEGSPWDKYYTGLPGVVIPKETIFDYYKSIVNKN